MLGQNMVAGFGKFLGVSYSRNEKEAFELFKKIESRWRKEEVKG